MNWFAFILFILILSNLMLLGSSRLAFCIRTVALQGVALGLLAIFMESHDPGLHIVFAATAIILKGAVFPWLLLRALLVARIKREVEPFIGFSLSLAIGFGALIGSFMLVARLPIQIPPIGQTILPLAIFTISTGLLLLVSRRKALSMVIGYLVLENGIYAIGLVMARDIPLIIEFGVLLDVWVAIFAMGIATYQINREFDHTNVDQLTQLRG